MQPSPISKSTLDRFARSGRPKQHLEQFLQFKKQYSNFIHPSRVPAIKKCFLHGICGRNSQGQVVVIDRIGNLKLNDLNKVLQDEEIVGYFFQRMLELSEDIVAEKERIVWVIDIGGKIMQLASKRITDMLGVLVANLQQHFPQLLSKLIFVNTPMLFDTIWGKLEGHVAKDTIENIIMVADDYESIEELMPISLLPQSLGGSRADKYFQENEFKPKLQQKDRQQSEKNLKDKEQYRQESSEQQQVIDFEFLKKALSSLKTNNGIASVSQTPLNTEADDSH